VAVLKYYNTTTSAWEYIAASTTANFTTWKKTMSGGETSVSGSDDNSVTLSYTVGLEQVFINGALQVRGTDYVATTGTSVTGLTALVASDIVSVVCYAPFNVANTIAPTVVDAKGDLIAGTAADTVGRLAVGANDLVLTAASGETTGLKYTGSWTSFTPTWTNLTVGNATQTAKYCQIGKVLFFEVRLVFGSTTSITGRVSLNWPVAPASTEAANMASVNLAFEDQSDGPYPGFKFNQQANTTKFELLPIKADGTYSKYGLLSSTVPFTWTTSDEINLSGFYEVA
jgi:hypothetical protein